MLSNRIPTLNALQTEIILILSACSLGYLKQVYRARSLLRNTANSLINDFYSNPSPVLLTRASVVLFSAYNLSFVYLVGLDSF